MVRKEDWGMSKEDKLFEMATTLPFQEEKDERDESSIPELLRVAELRDEGSAQEAIDYGKALIKMYPDNDLIPFMLAYIYYQRHFPDEALQIAIEAIPKCPRRYRLYSVAGLAEYDKDRLPEALVWWTRSVIAQCEVVDYQEADPFLYLAHIAQILGSKRQADVFFAMVDAIEPNTYRLPAADIEKLQAFKNSWARKPAEKVLSYVEDNYLHA